MDRSRSNPELEAKLAALPLEKRIEVEAVGLRLAKASLRKMLDAQAKRLQPTISETMEHGVLEEQPGAGSETRGTLAG
jgi:hypothetical protein